MATLDVALALAGLCPEPRYHGSLTPNTRRAYDRIVWRDDRAKPSWDEIVAWEAPEPEDDQLSLPDHVIADKVKRLDEKMKRVDELLASFDALDSTGPGESNG